MAGPESEGRLLFATRTLKAQEGLRTPGRWREKRGSERRESGLDCGALHRFQVIPPVTAVQGFRCDLLL